MKIKFIRFAKYFSIASCLILFIPGFSLPKFYQYINEDGVKCYTDDPSLISDVKDENIIVHKDKYDGLSREEKKKLKAKQARDIEESEQQTREVFDRFNKELQEEERMKKEAEHLKKTVTKVRILKNRVLVPVTMGYYGREITVELLLDTGASITAVSSNVAEQLELGAGKRSAARVAGGGIVRTRIVKIEYLKVGPKIYNEPAIMVFKKKGPAQDFHGLLGQDFLLNFVYTIDYEKSLIVWLQ